MKEELKAEMRAQAMKAINEKAEKQFELRTQTAQEVVPSAPSSSAPSTAMTEQKEEKEQSAALQQPQQGSKSSLSAPGKVDRAFRMNTKTEWDEQAMEKLKEDMKGEMMRQKQERIEQMFERDNELRPSEANPTHLAVSAPTGYGYVQSQDMEDIAAQQEKEDRERRARQEKEDQERAAMEAQMLQQKRDLLEAQTSTNWKLVTEPTVDDNTKSVVRSDNDREEMEKAMVNMNREALLRRMESTAHTVEPQIKTEHKDRFDALLKDIGIVNQTDVRTLWSHIDGTVNKHKRVEISGAGHGTSRSQMMEEEDTVSDPKFKSEMEENALQELKAQIRDKESRLKEVQAEMERERSTFNGERQELEQRLKEAQQQLEELQKEDDDMSVLTSSKETPVGPPLVEVSDETPRGPDPDENNHVQLEQVGADRVEELKLRIGQLQEEKKNMKSHYQKEQGKLEREMERICLSKIELLHNTSREINSLRKLLMDYVQLAQKQRSPLNL